MKKFGEWKVSSLGDLTYQDDRYEIESDSLTDNDWIHHMMTKGWVDLNDFIPAYFYALEKKGIQFTEERVFY